MQVGFLQNKWPGGRVGRTPSLTPIGILVTPSGSFDGDDATAWYLATLPVRHNPRNPDGPAC